MRESDYWDKVFEEDIVPQIEERFEKGERPRITSNQDQEIITRVLDRYDASRIEVGKLQVYILKRKVKPS